MLFLVPSAIQTSPFGRDTDTHHAAEFAGHREVAFLGYGIAIEICNQNCPVQAANPNFVKRHAGAPPDTVKVHPSESVDRPATPRFQ